MAILKMILLSLFIVNILDHFLIANSMENYTFYEVTAFNPHERQILYFMHIKRPSTTYINGVSNEAAIPIDIIVHNSATQKFEAKLESDGIQYNLISFISERQLKAKKMFTENVNISQHFYNWQIILKWLETKENKSGMFQKIVIAKTYEGRDIFFLKISQGGKKPAVFLVGGEDGLDWISSSLILNLLSEFVDNSNFKNLLNIFDFYLLPILNPDGFVYTKYKDRLWSKNRREIYPKIICADDNIAVGVNIARNWFWEKSSKTLGEECNSIYMGHKPLSEEETLSLSYVLNSLAQDMMAFINIRGFGRYMTIPYGNVNIQSNNYDIVREILKFTAYKVYKKYNVTYYVAGTSSIFYNFSGNMADWIKFKLNTPIVYTLYLENTSTLLPLPQQIEQLGKHFFTILNESLLMSYDIYHPLFNSKSIFKLNITLTIAIVFTHRLISMI